jgi:hypothetical protein
VGTIIDHLALGVDKDDPRSGSGLRTEDCGDSDSCVQVVGAIKDVTDVFKSGRLTIPYLETFRQQARSSTSSPVVDDRAQDIQEPSASPMPEPSNAAEQGSDGLGGASSTMASTSSHSLFDTNPFTGQKVIRGQYQ